MLSGRLYSGCLRGRKTRTNCADKYLWHVADGSSYPNPRASRTHLFRNWPYGSLARFNRFFDGVGLLVRSKLTYLDYVNKKYAYVKYRTGGYSSFFSCGPSFFRRRATTRYQS